ncbi:MAG: MoaD/ThiS family protein [candidate division WOR-3 bacterium]
MKLQVPAFLKHLTNGLTEIEVRATTVGECLDAIVTQFPLAKPLLFDERGRLHGYIEISVNGISAFPEELSRPVREGDTISMVYLIAGG